MCDNQFVFNIEKNLPFVSECLKRIIEFSPTNGSPKQNKCVSIVVEKIHEIYSEIFGVDKLNSKSKTRADLKTYLKNYDYVKKKGSKITQVRQFMYEHNVLLDIVRKDEVNNMDPRLKFFYLDQKDKRKYSIKSVKLESFEVGEKNIEQMNIDQDNFEINGDSALEVSDQIVIDKSEPIVLETSQVKILKQKVMRSGLVFTTSNSCDASTQTDEIDFSYTPSIRKKRNFLPKIKTALALGSVDAGITSNQSRKAFQSFAKNFYGQEFFLDVEEFKQLTELNDGEPSPKIPRNADSYKNYEFVLPSYQVVCDTKHELAIAQESKVANALLEKPEEVKVSLHYDTTTRQCIKGEWTSLVLEFSDGRTFDLKPMVMAVENSETISDFFVEELKRLAELAGPDVKPSDIWESIDSLMTDSVAKNIGKLITSHEN